MKFLCKAHVRGHVLWTCVSILENLLILFLYLLYICILVIQINIFQFNSIQFNLLVLLVCTPSPVEIVISSDRLFALVLDYLSKVV